MRIDYARGCFSDNELEAAYVRREWRRTTSTFAVTIVILIAALTVLASLCESDATWYLPFVSTCASVLALRMALRGTVSDEVAAQKTFCRVSTALMLTFICTTKDDPAASCKFRGGVEFDQSYGGVVFVLASAAFVLSLRRVGMSIRSSTRARRLERQLRRRQRIGARGGVWPGPGRRQAARRDV